jgi:hypothetical protein
MWSKTPNINVRGTGSAPYVGKPLLAVTNRDARFVAIQKTSQSHLRAAVLSRENSFLLISNL